MVASPVTDQLAEPCPHRRASRRPALPGTLRQGLRLDGLVLGLRDGAAVEQLLGLVDLARRAAVAGHRPDVVVHLRPLALRVLGPAMRHPVALRDQVDEHAEERQHDHEDRPSRLAPPREVAPAKDVGEDQDHHPDPGHPDEEDDHGPEDVEKRVVSGDRHVARRSLRSKGIGRHDRRVPEPVTRRHACRPQGCRPPLSFGLRSEQLPELPTQSVAHLTRMGMRASLRPALTTATIAACAAGMRTSVSR